MPDLSLELTIVAIASGDCSSTSIVLELTGPGSHPPRTESIAPYTLFGDGGGMLGGEELDAGTYTMSAFPVGLPVSNSLTISFTLS